MFVCLYVCMHICVYEYEEIRLHSGSYIHTHNHTSSYSLAHTCTHAYTHTHTKKHKYMCGIKTHAYMYTCMHIHACASMRWGCHILDWAHAHKRRHTNYHAKSPIHKDVLFYVDFFCDPETTKYYLLWRWVGKKKKVQLPWKTVHWRHCRETGMA